MHTTAVVQGVGVLSSNALFEVVLENECIAEERPLLFVSLQKNAQTAVVCALRIAMRRRVTCILACVSPRIDGKTHTEFEAVGAAAAVFYS